MDKSTAFDILGLLPSASEEEVKTAYRTLAQKYSPDNYDAGPLREEAETKMNEINEAFDTLMSLMRAGTTVEATRGPAPGSGASFGGETASAQTPGSYPQIRSLINAGRVDDALAGLTSVQSGANDAEWNFLMGSAYYYKGWLDQSLYYFQAAVRLDPSNAEYSAALRNLQGNAAGEMPGSPFAGGDNTGQAMNCACNTCGMICCMDACCSMGRGCC